MIISVGVDLVVIAEIALSLEKETFRNKVFTADEIAYCENYPRPAERYAGKFAAKEAFMKAIGLGIQQGLWFKQIDVRNHPTGAPYIITTGKAAQQQSVQNVTHIHISISHTQQHAIAIVILENRKQFLD